MGIYFPNCVNTIHSVYNKSKEYMGIKNRSFFKQLHFLEKIPVVNSCSILYNILVIECLILREEYLNGK